MRKQWINILLLCVMAVALFGCGRATEGDATSDGASTTAEEDYRSTFTQEELESGHAVFAVLEHLLVDAEVTPYDKYKDGLNSYYMDLVTEEGNMADEDYLDELTVFGQTKDSFFRRLSSVAGFDITADMLDWQVVADGYATVSAFNMDLTAGEDISYYISMRWEDEERLQEGIPYYPQMYLYKNAENNFWLYYIHNELNYCEMYYPPTEEDDTPLLSEDEILDYKAAVEDLTGRTLSDTWDCVQVSDEKIKLLKELQPDLEEYWNVYDSGTVEGYFFYYDIDGLPIEKFSLEYELQSGQTATTAVQRSKLSSTRLGSLYQCAQLVVTDGESLIGMELDSTRMPGEICEENLTIISPSDALAVVADYYDSQELSEDVTVTQVRLVYAAYFTDTGDSIVDNAFLPFWKIVAYDENENESGMFVFDAVSGEELMENSREWK